MSRELRPGLTIILPCYNAGPYLEDTLRQLAELFEAHADLELLVVDDGSREGDPASRIVEGHLAEPPFQNRIRCITHPENRGKGAAIMSGLAAVTTTLACYTDADLAYSPGNFQTMRECVVEGTMVIANRVDRESTYLIHPHYFRYIASRHLASRLLNLIVSMILIPGARDVQAGLKMAHTGDFLRCVKKSTRLRFSFDTELLFIAMLQGIRIHPVPVRYRYLSEASTVNFLLDSLRMARDVLLIRVNGWLGRYS